jgi:hypothetical protein
MIYFFYYLIFSISLSVIFISFFILSNYIMKKYPKSKLSNFFRNHIVSDIDEESYK